MDYFRFTMVHWHLARGLAQVIEQVARFLVGQRRSKPSGIIESSLLLQRLNFVAGKGECLIMCDQGHRFVGSCCFRCRLMLRHPYFRRRSAIVVRHDASRDR